MPYCPICEKCLYLNGRKGSENRKFQLGSNLRKHKALRASGVSVGGGGGGGRGSRLGPGAPTGSNEVVSTKCGHLYHQSCLNEYITNYRTKGDIYGTTYNVLCPLCGANLSNGKMLRIDLEAHFGILEEFFTDLCKLKYMNKELKRTLELEWVDISELEKKISDTKSEYEHVKGIKRNNEQKCKTTEDRIAKAIEDASTCYRYREIEKQLIDENINLEAVARRMETIISSRICTTYSTSKKQPTTSSETETVEENTSNNNIHINNMSVNDTSNTNNHNNNSNIKGNDIICHTSTISDNNNNNNNNNNANDEADHNHNRNNNVESCDNLPVVSSSTFPLHQNQHQTELEDEEHDHKNTTTNNNSMSLVLKQPQLVSPQNYEEFINNAAIERRSRYHQLSSGESYESIIRESENNIRNDQGHSSPLHENEHDSNSDFYTQNKGSKSAPKMGQGQGQAQGQPHVKARGQVDISVQISVHSAWSLNSVGEVESETVLLKRYAQEQRLTLCSRTGSNLSIDSSHLNLLENIQNHQHKASLTKDRKEESSDLQMVDKNNKNSLVEKYSSGGGDDTSVEKILSSIQLSTATNHNQISHFTNNNNYKYNNNNIQNRREIISSDYNISNNESTDQINVKSESNLQLLEYPCESEWKIEEKDSVTSEFSPHNNNNNNNILSEMDKRQQTKFKAIEANLMVNVDKSKSYTVRTYQHSTSSSLIQPQEILGKESERKNQKLNNNNNIEFHHDITTKEEEEEDKGLIPVDKSRSYTIQTFDHSTSIYNSEVGPHHDNFWPPEEITSSESIDPLLRSLLYPTPTYNQNINRRNRTVEKRLTRNHNDLPAIRSDNHKPIILPPPTNYKSSEIGQKKDNNNNNNYPINTNFQNQLHHPNHYSIMDSNSHQPNRKLATTAVVENSVILGKYSMCFVPSHEDIEEGEEQEQELLQIQEKESEIITEENQSHKNKSSFSYENSNNNNNNKARSKNITRKLKTLSLRRHQEDTNTNRTLKQFVITPPHMYASEKMLQLSPSKNDDEDQQPSCSELSLSFPPLPSIPNLNPTTSDNEVKPGGNSTPDKNNSNNNNNSGRREKEKQRKILPTFDQHWILPPPPSKFESNEITLIVPPPPPMSPSPRQHRHCHQHTRESMMGFKRTGEENGNENDGKTTTTTSSSSFPCETPESTRKLLESLLLKSPPSSPRRHISTNNNNNNSSSSVTKSESSNVKMNSVSNSLSTSIIAPPDLYNESDDEDERLHSLIENNNNNNYETCSSNKNEKDLENPFMNNSGGGDVFEEFANQNQNVMSINNLSINRNHIIPNHHITPSAEENQIKYVITTTTTTSHHHHHHQATSTQTLKSTQSKPDYVCLAAERFVQDTCLQTSSEKSVNVGVEPADDLRNSHSRQQQLHHHHHLQQEQNHNHNIHHPYNMGVSTGVGIGIGISKNDQGQYQHQNPHQREQQQQHINRQQYNHNNNRHHYMCVLSPSDYYNNNDHGYSLSNAPSRYWSFENTNPNTNTNPVTTPVVIEDEQKILSNHFLKNSDIKRTEIEGSNRHHHHPQDGEDVNINNNNNTSIRPRPAYFSPTPLPAPSISYALLHHGRRKSSHVNINNANVFNSPYESRVSLPFLEHDQQQHCLNLNLNRNHHNNANASLSSHDLNGIANRQIGSTNHNYEVLQSGTFIVTHI